MKLRGKVRTVGRVVLFVIASALLLITAGSIDRQFPALPPGLLIAAITSAGTFGLTALFVRWDKGQLEDVGASFSSKSVARFLFGFGLGLILVAAHVSIEATVGHIRWVRSDAARPASILTMLLLYVLLASREELAFRGYPLRRLSSSYGLWISLFVMAAVFSLEHVAGGWTWSQAVFGAGVGSFLFGMAALTTRGLAVPIGLHAAWNLGDWMHGGKDSTGIWNPVLPENLRHRADSSATLGYIAVMLIATFAFWRWGHARMSQDVEISTSSGK